MKSKVIKVTLSVKDLFEKGYVKRPPDVGQPLVGVKNSKIVTVARNRDKSWTIYYKEVK